MRASSSALPLWRNPPAGLRDMVLAALLFSVMSLLVKIAGQSLPTGEIVFFRSAFSLVFSYVLVRRAGLTGWGANKKLLVLRGVMGFFSLVCFFHATVWLPLADATTLHFTNPVFTALLAAIFLGERLRVSDMVGSLISLSGVLLVARPSFLFGAHAALDPVAVTVALGGSLAAAIAYTAVRKSRESDPPAMVVLYFPLIATPASIPLLFAHARWPSASEWLLLLGLGVVTQIAQIFLTQGLHAAAAGRAMSMSYVQVVFAAMWGWLFFADPPEPMTIAGAVLVGAGTLLTARTPRPTNVEAKVSSGPDAAA